MDCISPFILFAAAIAMIVYVFKHSGRDQTREETVRMRRSSSSGENDGGMARMARGMIMLDMLEYGIPPWNLGDNEDNDPPDEENYDTDIDYDDYDIDDSDYEGYDD